LWAAIVVFTAALFLAVPHMASGDPPPAGGLAIEELDGGVRGQLQVRWTLDPSALQEADQVTLELVDGGTTRNIDLEADEFLGGSLTYVRRTGDVQVRLHVLRRGQPPLREYARFLGQAVAEPAHHLPAASDAASELPVASDAAGPEPEAERLRQAIELERDETRKLQESIRRIEDRLRQENALYAQ
jgi:hypothetical protein